MKRLLIAGFVAAAAAAPFAQAATETLVVTPVETRGWSTADTRPGGTVAFVLDNTAPRGTGALQLTTDATTAAKAQYMHSAETPLADLTDLSYYTRTYLINPDSRVVKRSYDGRRTRRHGPD